jgi:hypothetical protein
MVADHVTYRIAKVGSIPATSKGALPRKVLVRASLEVRQHPLIFGPS